MDIQTLTYIFVGATFVLYIGIAIGSRVSSTRDFYVAGGHIHPLANGMATAADWMSAASFISMAGLIAFMGRDGGIYLMGWTGGYVLLAMLLAPYLRKFGEFTVPDFVGERYYSNAARGVAIVCVIFISFTYIAGQMRGVGIVFSRFLEVDVNIGVVIGMAIVFLYAELGGMKGITYTQVAQYCVLIFAYMVPAIFISLLMTGIAIPQLGFGAELADQPGVYLLDRLDGLTHELGFGEYTSGKRATIDVFFMTAALMVGTAGLPHVIVRFFTVPKVRDARRSASYALLFIAILYTTAPAVAAFARTNMIQTINQVEYSAVPGWFSNWESTGLVSFEDKDGDGRIDYTAGDDNELMVNRDIMVLANPEIARLPNWVIALVAAGGLAAALSTAAGLLLVISAAISHDLLKRTIARQITDKQELRYARYSAAAAILVAGYFGINPPGFVAQVVAFAFGLAAASFFPILLMGIFYKRLNKEGAISGMSAGLIFTFAYIVYFKFISPETNIPEYWWFGISPEGIGTLGMLLNFAVAITVSHFTPPPPPAVQAMVERIRIPRGSADPRVPENGLQ